MANYVKTILTFNGSDEGIQKIKDFVKGYYIDYEGKECEHPFDFRKIAPYPSEDECPSRYYIEESELEVDRYSGKKTYCRRCAIQVLEDMPYLDWYTWQLDKWGTKWNACEPIGWDGDSVYFDTAWSFCEPILETLSKKFPKVRIEFEYADEDLGVNCDSGYFLNGKITRTNCHGKDHHVFAEEIWGREDDYATVNGKRVFKEDLDNCEGIIDSIVEIFEDELERTKTGTFTSNNSNSSIVIPVSHGKVFIDDVYNNIFKRLEELIDVIRGDE